jgi:hypothetical protein
MRTSKSVLIAALLCSSLPTFAAQKKKGSTALKDLQPAGTTDKKQKHQRFDFTFDVSGTEYVCRSSEGSKLSAIDWPVGSNISYEVEKDKGKLKNAKGKEVGCTVVRVEAIKPSQAAVPSN